LNSTFGELIDHKKMTPEAFEVFKLKLKKEKNAAQRKQIIIILATLLILAFLFLGMPYLF
ncbi:hypothetical protein, partial [Altibacter sp.]|uniref:hypothetical protein n=1 Tax=Altibacter sp. TaxID=2024823 RepID=UPI000C9443F9